MEDAREARELRFTNLVRVDGGKDETVVEEADLKGWSGGRRESLSALEASSTTRGSGIDG